MITFQCKTNSGTIKSNSIANIMEALIILEEEGAKITAVQPPSTKKTKCRQATIEDLKEGTELIHKIEGTTINLINKISHDTWKTKEKHLFWENKLEFYITSNQ